MVQSNPLEFKYSSWIYFLCYKNIKHIYKDKKQKDYRTIWSTYNNCTEQSRNGFLIRRQSDTGLLEQLYYPAFMLSIICTVDYVSQKFNCVLRSGFN